MKCLPRVRLQGAPHVRQGIPHLGTKGNTSHPDCALFLLADCPGRGSSLPMSGSEVEVFWAPTDASIGSAGSTLSSPVVSVFIVRTSVKHLSTGPCMGLSSRVVVTVALRDRGHLLVANPYLLDTPCPQRDALQVQMTHQKGRRQNCCSPCNACC